MNFGIRLPVNGPFASKDSILQIANLAEEYSFHSVWSQGHLLWSDQQHQTQISVGSVEALSSSQHPNMFDSFSTLFYAASITKNVRLGSAVFVVPLLHPVLAARLLANMDVLSGGRLIFCVAPGGPLIKKDFDTLNINFSERASMADECIESILKLWTSDVASYEGNIFRFSDISLYPKPVQKPHPPIWIAGGNPNAVRRAAKFGDGWMLTTSDPRTVMGGISGLATGYHKLKERTRSYGRKIEDFVVDIYGCIAETDELAANISHKTISARLERQARSANLNVPSQEQVESINLIGSASTIAKKVEDFEKIGVTLLELKMTCWSLEQMKDMILTFSKDIMRSFT